MTNQAAQTSSPFWDKINADYVARGGVIRPEVWSQQPKGPGRPQRTTVPRPPGFRGGRTKLEPNAADREMRRRYEEDKVSLSVIGKENGLSPSGARKAIVRAGGTIRSRKEGSRLKFDRRVTPEEEALFERRYVDGESAKEIALSVGLDVNMIRRILAARGVKIRDRAAAQKLAQRHRRKIKDDQAQELRRLYEAGESLNALALRFGFTREQVTQAVQESGAVMRTRSEAVRKSNSERHNQPGEQTA